MKKILILSLVILFVGQIKIFAQEKKLNITGKEVVLKIDGATFTGSRDSLLSLFEQQYLILRQTVDSSFIRLVELDKSRAGKKIVFRSQEIVGIFERQERNGQTKWILVERVREKIPKGLQGQPMVINN